MRNTQVTARTEPKLKAATEVILRRIGLSMSDAINIFLNQVVLNKGLPFDVKIPTETTTKAMKDAISDRDLTLYGSADELFEDLGIDH